MGKQDTPTIGRLISRELAHVATAKVECPNCGSKKPNDGQDNCVRCPTSQPKPEWEP